jgi:hypothetical protein
MAGKEVWKVSPEGYDMFEGMVLLLRGPASSYGRTVPPLGTGLSLMLVPLLRLVSTSGGARLGGVFLLLLRPVSTLGGAGLEGVFLSLLGPVSMLGGAGFGGVFWTWVSPRVVSMVGPGLTRGSATLAVPPVWASACGRGFGLGLVVADVLAFLDAFFAARLDFLDVVEEVACVDETST